MSDPSIDMNDAIQACNEADDDYLNNDEVEDTGLPLHDAKSVNADGVDKDPGV